MSRHLPFTLLVLLMALSGCRAPSFDPAVPGTAVEKHLLMLDLAQAGKRLLGVGEAGSIVYSDDHGAHWTRANVPTHALLTSVYFVDDQHGWAVGHDMLILATHDGGRNWSQQYAAPQESRPLLDVWFRTPREGYAVGAYGAMLATTDGGTSWRSIQNPEDDRHLYTLLGLPDGGLLVAGETGTVKRSGDQGQTWQPVTTPYPGSFFGLLQLHDGTLLLFGLRGHILRSVDQGRQWEEIPSPTQASLMGGTVLGNGHVLLVGAGGSLIESADAGKTFSARPGAGHLGWSSIIESAPTLLLAGEAGIQPLRN